MKPQQSVFTLGSTIVLVIGTVFLIAGYCVLTFWGKPTLKNAKESVNWPTVPGVVTESKVESHSGDDGTTYSADVTYKYTVDETEISSERIWFGDNYSSSNRKQFAKIVSEYPVGIEVTVFYKHDDPFIAVLKPGAVFSSYIGFGLGWGLLVVGGGLLLIPMTGFLKLVRCRSSGRETYPIDS